MTDEERKQLEKLASKMEYLVQEGVHFSQEDHNVIVYALTWIGQAHNNAMFQTNG
jgi:hypothetical protein